MSATTDLIERLRLDNVSGEEAREPTALLQLAMLERISDAIERLADAVGVIAGEITQPDASEETGAPDPLSTMDR
jgi:hypothetical protein